MSNLSYAFILFIIEFIPYFFIELSYLGGGTKYADAFTILISPLLASSFLISLLNLNNYFSFILWFVVAWMINLLIVKLFRSLLRRSTNVKGKKTNIRIPKSIEDTFF